MKIIANIVESPESGHAREAEKVSATGAGRVASSRARIFPRASPARSPARSEKN